MSASVNTPLGRLKDLAKGLPKGLTSDWAGSNHFEMNSDEDEYFWLFVRECFDDIENPMESTIGKRFGLMMDIAAEVARLRDEGFLGQ